MEEITLRPHHGMCLAYYQGYGYSERFNQRMQEMLEAVGRNPVVKLQVAADCICADCPSRQGERCETEAKVAGYDRQVLSACGLEEGATLPFLTFAAQVQGAILSPGKREAVCGSCQWSSLCNGKSRWEHLEP